jgi:phosphohistidine phosphatase
MPNAPVHLHFLRHAHAGDPAKWAAPDFDRPLSDRGRRQAEALGAHLAALGIEFDTIISSPLIRARQTAALVAESLAVTVAIDDRLAGIGGGLGIASLAGLLRDHDSPSRPILVGHDPDFSELVSRLVGAPAIPIRKGTLARIDIELPIRAGTGILAWLVPPEVIAPS